MPRRRQPTSPRPLLVYDGDCGFCTYWARYWQKLTSDRVEYRPYQEVAVRYPAISQADFQRAVQFIAPDGHVASAAEASFLTLSHARGKGFWLALYRNLPGFATISELAYAFIAAHRPAFFRASLLLWGRNHEPPRYDLVSFLFLRLFGLVYLSAFVSFAVQAQGLIGSHGILPVAEMVDDLAGVSTWSISRPIAAACEGASRLDPETYSKSSATESNSTAWASSGERWVQIALRICASSSVARGAEQRYRRRQALRPGHSPARGQQPFGTEPSRRLSCRHIAGRLHLQPAGQRADLRVSRMIGPGDELLQVSDCHRRTRSDFRREVHPAPSPSVSA